MKTTAPSRLRQSLALRPDDQVPVAQHAGCHGHKRGARPSPPPKARRTGPARSEEHTSELQSLMRISYAVFCLKKKKYNQHITSRANTTPLRTTHSTNHQIQQS